MSYEPNDPLQRLQRTELTQRTQRIRQLRRLVRRRPALSSLKARSVSTASPTPSEGLKSAKAAISVLLASELTIVAVVFNALVFAMVVTAHFHGHGPTSNPSLRWMLQVSFQRLARQYTSVSELNIKPTL